MPPTSNDQPGMTWLVFALLTVITWGVYGVFLHSGQLGMHDVVNGRYKAFLFVGIAYFLVAIIGPILLLALSGANWSFPVRGMVWSLIAGTVGAIGALGVLLAFGAGGKPPVVMTIIFAGAPIVNAIVALLQHPPAGGWGSIRAPFWLGIFLAITGAALVTKFKPGPPAPKTSQAAGAAGEAKVVH